MENFEDIGRGPKDRGEDPESAPDPDTNGELLRALLAAAIANAEKKE